VSRWADSINQFLAASEGLPPEEVNRRLGMPYTPADAASRQGIDLSPDTAKAVAEAVLECADGEHRVSMEVADECWPEAASTARRRLRHALAVELADAELLPTALPREVVTRPAQPWGLVKIELVVPVRHPPAPR
jgi:hypothetical protein